MHACSFHKCPQVSQARLFAFSAPLESSHLLQLLGPELFRDHVVQ